MKRNIYIKRAMKKRILTGIFLYIFMEISVGVIFGVIASIKNVSLENTADFIHIGYIIKIVSASLIFFVAANAASFFMIKIGEIDKFQALRGFFLFFSVVGIVFCIFNSFNDYFSIVGIIFLIPILISCIVWLKWQ